MTAASPLDPSFGAPLVLAAHGSADPRFGEVVSSVADGIAALRPGLQVRVGYLEHGPPDLADVTSPGCIVVPLLLSSGFHVHTDIPAQAPGCLVTAAVGPDRRIAAALADRLREAGWRGQHPVALAAAGSADPRALADVRQAASDLGDELGASVTAAFLSAGEPRLGSVDAQAVATYLLAPGHFADVVASCGAPIIAAPIGADPRLAEIALARYDTVS